MSDCERWLLENWLKYFSSFSNSLLILSRIDKSADGSAPDMQRLSSLISTKISNRKFGWWKRIEISSCLRFSGLQSSWHSKNRACSSSTVVDVWFGWTLPPRSDAYCTWILIIFNMTWTSPRLRRFLFLGPPKLIMIYKLSLKRANLVDEETNEQDNEQDTQINHAFLVP